METIYSSAVNTATLRIPFLLAGPGSNAFGWYQVNFATAGEWIPTYTQEEFEDASSLHITPALGGVIPFQEGDTTTYWIVTTPTLSRRFTVTYNFHTIDTPPKLDQQCIAMRLETLNAPAKTAYGRVMLPGVRTTDVEGSRLTASANARLSPLLDFYTSPFTVGGITYAPSVWSRKLNIMQPCTAASLCQRVSYLQKRSGRWKKKTKPIFWPIAW